MAFERQGGRPPTDVVSQDSLFGGRMVCRQHRSGYRFSIDSVLLAHFPLIKTHEHILDLGTGCGIIGLIFCYRHTEKSIRLTGIERQHELVELAQSNIEANNCAHCFSVIKGRLDEYRSLIEPESFSLVVANPPYYRQGTGRVSRDREKMAARHQQGDGLAEFVGAASYAVKNRGRTTFIYPAELAAELFSSFEAHRIAPKRMRLVYSYPESKNASLIILEGIKNGGAGLEALAPLYIYRHRNGPYSIQVQAMFEPQDSTL